VSQRLRLSFAEGDVFRREFVCNIANGGAYVQGACDAVLRARVEVELDLCFCGESLVLEAEVVHVDEGGVAVQFLTPASELRERLEPLLRTKEAGGGLPDEDRSAAVGLAPTADPLDHIGERRRAPRASAQLAARLGASHLELDGLTRDLSEHGVLISADGSDLPLGRRVELEFRDPQTGSRLHVEGHVSRHIETEGTVAAVAVAFDGVDGSVEQLNRFVRDVKRAEQARIADGISGRIEVLGMANLIQMLGSTSSQGTLTATHGSEQGVISFAAGQLQLARLGSLMGLKALARMLAWEEGRFDFHREVLAQQAGNGREGQPILLEAAVLEASRMADDLARIASAELVPESRFRLDRAMLAGETSLSKTEEAVLDLAGADFSLRRMLDVIPEPDAAIVAAITSLLDRAVLMQDDASR